MTDKGGWFGWDASWGWGLALIAATIVIHSAGIIGIILWMRRLHIGEERDKHYFFHGTVGAMIVIAMVSLMLAVLHAIECALWAWVYVAIGAIPDYAESVLYSVDSMTTRGATSLSLAHHWDLMGALEAADGMLVFGISTAFLFATMQRIGGTLMGRR